MTLLNTERLRLRPLTPDDAPAAFAWSGDARVTRFLGFSPYESVDGVRQWLESVQHPRPDEPMVFGIERRSDALLIGSIEARRAAAPDTWTFGYCLRFDCWNRGYATEAARALLRHVREAYGARRFEAQHAVENPASGRVIEKCGLRFDRFGEYAKRDGSAVFASRIYVCDASELR